MNLSISVGLCGPAERLLLSEEEIEKGYEQFFQNSKSALSDGGGGGSGECGGGFSEYFRGINLFQINSFY